MFGAKTRARLRRRDSVARCCDDSQADFGAELEADLDFRLLDQESVEMWERQWLPISQRCPPEGGWDWREIHNGTRHKADEFCIAMRHGNTTLCGLCLLEISGNSVNLVAIEGNPDENHPLKGKVLTIGADILERLADSFGRMEVRVVEPSEGLLELYVSELGFRLEDEGGRRVLKRRV
jgi:hypothetical protein